MRTHATYTPKDRRMVKKLRSIALTHQQISDIVEVKFPTVASWLRNMGMVKKQKRTKIAKKAVTVRRK